MRWLRRDLDRLSGRRIATHAGLDRFFTHPPNLDPRIRNRELPRATPLHVALAHGASQPVVAFLTTQSVRRAVADWLVYQV